MTAPTVKGIDLSVYQGAPLSGSWRAMVMDGVEVAVVGSWHGTRANQYAMVNLARASLAGLKTATYFAINGSRPGEFHVEAGRITCGDEWEHLNFVAIDVEIRGVTEEILDDALARVTELGGRPCLDRPGGVSRYVRYPLWTAFYDGRPTLDVPLYGGWERAVGHQYAGTTAAYGTQVDLNVFDAEWVEAWPAPPPPPPPPPEEVETMPSKEYQELKGLVDHLGREVRSVAGSLTKHVKGHPKPAPAPAPKPGPRYYTVVSGDVASVIAERHGLSWLQFRALNRKGPPSGKWKLIYPGEKYRVA